MVPPKAHGKNVTVVVLFSLDPENMGQELCCGQGKRNAADKRMYSIYFLKGRLGM